MITITIGGITKSYDEAVPHWINEQFKRRRQDGLSISVAVNIKKDAIEMVLASPRGAGGPGGRGPTEQEQEIFDLWDRMHLNDAEFTGGNLIAFLRQVKSLR